MDTSRFKEMLEGQLWELQQITRRPGNGEGVVHALKESGEHASDSVQTDVVYGINSVHTEKHQAITEALERIEKGTYGICKDCGEPIAEGRLNALPFAKQCITCKEKNPGESAINVVREHRALRNPYRRTPTRTLNIR